MASPSVDKPKVALFVDIQNIYYTTKAAFGRQFNYKKLIQTVANENDIIQANAYAIERHDPKQKQFQNTLKTFGFNVKLKPFIQRSDGSAKGDWDVGITIDMMAAANTVDKVILLSGDGDFDLLLTHLSKQHNVLTEVYGVPSLTAESLIQSADTFTPIDQQFLL